MNRYIVLDHTSEDHHSHYNYNTYTANHSIERADYHSYIMPTPNHSLTQYHSTSSPITPTPNHSLMPSPLHDVDRINSTEGEKRKESRGICDDTNEVGRHKRQRGASDDQAYSAGGNYAHYPFPFPPCPRGGTRWVANRNNAEPALQSSHTLSQAASHLLNNMMFSTLCNVSKGNIEATGLGSILREEESSICPSDAFFDNTLSSLAKRCQSSETLTSAVQFVSMISQIQFAAKVTSYVFNFTIGKSIPNIKSF